MPASQLVPRVPVKIDKVPVASIPAEKESNTSVRFRTYRGGRYAYFERVGPEFSLPFRRNRFVVGSRLLVVYTLLAARPAFDSASTGVR